MEGVGGEELEVVEGGDDETRTMKGKLHPPPT